MAEVVITELLQRVGVLEREMRDQKADFKEHVTEDRAAHEKLETEVQKTASSQGRIELMVTHITELLGKVDKKVDEVAAAAGKDQSWRAVITDILKMLFIVGTAIAGGKIFG